MELTADLITTSRPGGITNGADVSTRALDLLLSDSRSEETRRAYRNDLADFFRFHAGSPLLTAARELFQLEAGQLALALNAYKADLLSRRLAESTVNRRLAAVRALLRMARRLGASCPDPAGLVSSEKSRAYRDTRGPALVEARRLLEAPDTSTVRGLRDRTLLLLLCENALRRGELHRCDVGDFDRSTRQLQIIGKGRGTQKEPITLSETSAAALGAYLSARGNPPADAPLFVNAARFSKGGQRITGRGLYHVVNRYGQQVLGRTLRPHALRHFAITACLDATGGDIRTAQRLSRHADLRTLRIYDDCREDLQGRATELLSSLLAPGGHL